MRWFRGSFIDSRPRGPGFDFCYSHFKNASIVMNCDARGPQGLISEGFAYLVCLKIGRHQIWNVFIWGIIQITVALVKWIQV